MSCKYKSSPGFCNKTSCKSGDHCQCRTKNGGDSTKEIFTAMLIRINRHLIDGQIHFGHLVKDLKTHLSLCEKSAKEHLKDMCLQKHIEILPNIERPQMVRIVI